MYKLFVSNFSIKRVDMPLNNWTEQNVMIDIQTLYQIGFHIFSLSFCWIFYLYKIPSTEKEKKSAMEKKLDFDTWQKLV